MAIRKLRFKGDDILTKKARKIEVIDDKIKELAEDMLDTMYANDGIGLAACQVGMLKQMIVYDVKYIDEKHPKKEPHVVINPVITEKSKSLVTVEYCISGMLKSGELVTILLLSVSLIIPTSNGFTP